MPQPLSNTRKISKNSKLTLFIVLLLSCILYIGCSKNSSNPSKNNIVGKWYYAADTASLYTWPGNQFIENLQTDIIIGSSFVQYNADGTGASHVSSTDSAMFTYKVDGNKIIYYSPAHILNGLQIPAATDTAAIKTFTTSSLVLYSEFIDPPNGGIRYRNTNISYYVKR
jgi:hypothetical protein